MKEMDGKTLKTLRTNIEIDGLEELRSIVEEMIELASRLQKVELTIKASLPRG